MKNSVVAIKDIELNNLDGYFKTGSKANTKVVKLTDENAREAPAQPLPWKVTVASLRFNNNQFVYDDNTQPHLKKGMDFAHLGIADLTLHADDFLFHNDTIATNIVEGHMKEKSGFELNKFQTNVVYTDHGASLQDLLIETPGSQIKKSAVIRYPSLAAIQKEMGLLEMNIDLENSYLQVKDILTFVPTLASQPAFKNPSAKIYVDARLTGSLDRLTIEKFQFRGLGNTRINIAGAVGHAMDAKNVTADLTIKDFTTSRADIESLVPAGTLPKGVSLPETLTLTGRIRGGMRRMEINNLQFRDSRNTNIYLTGVINNAADPNAVSADIAVRRFSLNKGEILALAPAGTIPSTITLPQNMSLTGRIKGGMKDMFADLTLQTSLGSAKLTGKISDAADKVRARYNATLSATGLNLGTIMQQPANLGMLTAEFNVTGKGYDPEKANATLSGVVKSAEVMKYTYQNFKIDASLADQKFTGDASIADPNIRLALHASGDMGGNLPGFRLDADIDSIKTKPLNLTPDPIYYRGKIAADFPEFNLDALDGAFFVTNSLLVMNGQRIALDTLSVKANHQNNQEIIALNTGFISATIKGQYKLQQLGAIMMEAVQPYYAIVTVDKSIAIDPYDFTIDANVIDHPTLHAFVPDLKRFDGINLTSTFTSSNGWKAAINMPHVTYGTNTIDSLTLRAAAEDSSLRLATNVGKISSGTSISLYGTNLIASLADNTINFGLSIRDKNSKNKYKVAGTFAQEPDSIYAFSLRPDSLMLNYNSWTVSGDNKIRFGSSLVNANNFDLVTR